MTEQNDQSDMPNVIYAVENSHMASDCRWSRKSGEGYDTPYLRNDFGDDGVVVDAGSG